VRPALASDADAIARVHLTSWRTTYADVLPGDYLDGLRKQSLASRWMRRLESGEIDEAVRVLEVDGRVGGFVSFGPQKDDPTWLGYSGEVFMLYLEPRLMGRGMGRALLRRAYDELTRCQCHWVVVWVLSRNDGARRFYEREGLALDGARRWDTFGDRSVPVVRYARSLNPVVDFEELAASRTHRH
jgi:GNAT superfamily N-acetyltransferase